MTTAPSSRPDSRIDYDQLRVYLTWVPGDRQNHAYGLLDALLADVDAANLARIAAEAALAETLLTHKAEVERLEGERDVALRLQVMEAGATTEVRNRLIAAEARVKEMEEVLRTSGLLRNDLLEQLRRDGHGYPSFHVSGCPGCALLGAPEDPDTIPGVRNAEPGA